MTLTANKPRRFVIVTGDDFGYSDGVNRAVIEAHERGVLTSASLMVTGEAFEEAVRLAHQHPRLAVGLHLVLVSGRSALPARQIPDLVDREGRFSSNVVLAGLRYQLHPKARRQIRLEIRAQLERFSQTGLKLSHVDGHRHMHLPPIVLQTLLELAKEFGIRAIRLPLEEMSTTLRLDREGWLEKAALSATFRLLRRVYAQRLFESAGIRFVDRVYGLLQSGRMTEEYLLGLIPKIQAERVEIYSHLTTETDGHSSRCHRGASPAQLAALLSDQVRQALVQHGFQLATYSQVNGCTVSPSSSVSSA